MRFLLVTILLLSSACIGEPVDEWCPEESDYPVVQEDVDPEDVVSPEIPIEPRSVAKDPCPWSNHE